MEPTIIDGSASIIGLGKVKINARKGDYDYYFLSPNFPIKYESNIKESSASFKADGKVNVRPNIIANGESNITGQTITNIRPSVLASAKSYISSKANLFINWVRIRLSSGDIFGQALLDVRALRLIIPEGSYSITADDYFTKNQPANSDNVANYIIVETQPLRPVEIPEQVYESDNIPVEAGEEQNISIEFDKAPVIDAEVKLKYIDMNTVITSQNFYDDRAEITLENDSDYREKIKLTLWGLRTPLSEYKDLIVATNFKTLSSGESKWYEIQFDNTNTVGLEAFHNNNMGTVTITDEDYTEEGARIRVTNNGPVSETFQIGILGRKLEKLSEGIFIMESDTVENAIFDYTEVYESKVDIEKIGSEVEIIDTKYYATGADVTIYNYGSLIEGVVIEAIGRPLEVRGAEKVISKDDRSITENGKIEYKLPTNHLIQTKEMAQVIADKLRDSFSNPKRDVSIDWRGNPALILADLIEIPEFQKLGINQIGKFHVTRQNLEYDGGLRVNTEGRKNE